MELLDGRDQGASQRKIAKVAKGSITFWQESQGSQELQGVKEVTDWFWGSLDQGL